MRILHMIPDIGISNGVMSVILSYAKAMPEDIKFDVVYFSAQEKTRQADIEALGGRVYKIDAPSPKDLLTGKMNSFFSAHKNEWSALHIHCPHFALFIAPYAKKAKIHKIAVHCHATEYSLNGNGRRNKLLSLYAKYFIRDKFACGSEAGRLWYGNKRFTVLNNAVNCDELRFNADVRAQVRQQMQLDDSFVVGHIGKTSIKQKNHPFLFRIFAEVKKQKNNAKLLLIGGEETEALTALSQELGIENDVLYLGARTDIPRLLQAFDVFLFPSTSEGLPVSVVEAQAAGLGAVISDAVTDEVIVSSDMVCTMSLSHPAKEWAQRVLRFDAQRKDTFSLVKEAGWDIVSNAKILIDYYRG